MAAPAPAPPPQTVRVVWGFRNADSDLGRLATDAVRRSLRNNHAFRSDVKVAVTVTR